MKLKLKSAILAVALTASMQASAVQPLPRVIGLWDIGLGGEQSSGIAAAFGASSDVLSLNAGIEAVAVGDSCTTTTGVAIPAGGASAVYRTTTKKLQFRFQTTPATAVGAKYTLILGNINLTSGAYPDYTNASNITSFTNSATTSGMDTNFNNFYGATNFKFASSSKGNVLITHIGGATSGCWAFPTGAKGGMGVVNGTGASSANKYFVAGVAVHGYYGQGVSTTWTNFDVSRYGIYVYTLPATAIAANTTIAVTAQKIFTPIHTTTTYGEIEPSFSGVGAYGFNGLAGDMVRVAYAIDTSATARTWTYEYYALPALTLIGRQQVGVTNPL